ncbi:transcriptional regulator with XRE-family HTH domain [Staphylococcus pasteuri]
MNNAFGRNIKQLRGSNTVRKVAKEIGISHTYLHTLENGTDPRNNKRVSPSVDTVYKIASFYDVDINKMFEWLITDIKEAYND